MMLLLYIDDLFLTRKQELIKVTRRRLVAEFEMKDFDIDAHSISKEVAGFSLLWFPQGKLFVSLVSCDYFCACYSLI